MLRKFNVVVRIMALADDNNVNSGILVVDNDESAGRVLQTFLSQTFNQSVDLASTVLDAAQLIKCGSYMIVICDYEMSEQHGSVLLQFMEAYGIQNNFVFFTTSILSEVPRQSYGRPVIKKTHWQDLVSIINARLQEADPKEIK